MATKTEVGEVRFTFCDEQEFKGAEPGIDCDYCGERYQAPGVVTLLRGFCICPACVLLPVENVAEKAKNVRCRMRQEEDPAERKDIGREYLAISKGLHGVESFRDLAGGATAIALAMVPLETVARGYVFEEYRQDTTRGLKRRFELFDDAAKKGWKKPDGPFGWEEHRDMVASVLKARGKAA